MKRIVSIIVSLCVVMAVVMQATAQVKQGKTRPAKTKQLMKGLVAANCGALGEALKSDPADDKAWEDLALKAALLNEASYILMDDGRCPDGDWENAAMKLREGSETVLAKVEARDLAGAQESFKALTQACGACHKAHKK